MGIFISLIVAIVLLWFLAFVELLQERRRVATVWMENQSLRMELVMQRRESPYRIPYASY